MCQPQSTAFVLQKEVHGKDANIVGRVMQDAAQVAPQYQLDELTDEWQSTLGTIDDHLYQVSFTADLHCVCACIAAI